MTKLYSEKIDLTKHQEISDKLSTLGTAEYSVEFDFAQKYNPNKWKLDNIIVSIYNKKNNILIEREKYDSTPTPSECQTIIKVMEAINTEYLIGSLYEKKYTKSDFINNSNN